MYYIPIPVFFGATCSDAAFDASSAAFAEFVLDDVLSEGLLEDEVGAFESSPPVELGGTPRCV